MTATFQHATMYRYIQAVVVVVVDANWGQLRFKKFPTLDTIFFLNNVKTMELQTGEFLGWDRSPVVFTKTGGVSQFATIATTHECIMKIPVENIEMSIIKLLGCHKPWMQLHRRKIGHRRIQLGKDHCQTNEDSWKYNLEKFTGKKFSSSAASCNHKQSVIISNKQ